MTSYTTYFTLSREEVFLLEVPGHRDEEVVGNGVVLPKVPHMEELGVLDAFRGSEHLMCEGSVLKAGFSHQCTDHSVWFFLISGDFVEYSRFFKLELFLEQAWVHHLTEEGEQRFKLLARSTGIGACGIGEGSRIYVCPKTLEGLEKLESAAGLGTPKEHLFQEMSSPRWGGTFFIS